MRPARLTGIVLFLVVSSGAVRGQIEDPRMPPPLPLRWTGAADWELYRSDSQSQGVDSSFDSFRQKYSLGADGFLWDPRFSRYSAGLDFFLTDRESNGEQLDSDTFGYRLLTTFFPTRRFPLNLYARSSATDVAGVALADSDRETDAWGVEWNFVGYSSQRLRLLFDRTSYDVLSPILLQERRKSGVLDFSQKIGGSDLSLRYGINDQQERVSNSDFSRQELTLADRTGFGNGSTLVVNAHYTRSDATFTTGVRDELSSSRLGVRYDLPRGSRVRIGMSYDLNDHDGKFVNSSSHAAKADGRFSLNEHWESTGALTLGRIDSASATSSMREDLYGGRAGVRYIREWSRLHLTASYSIGYDTAQFNAGEDRRSLSQHAEVSNRVPLNHNDEVFVTLSRVLDDNDTTGVAFRYDEDRITVGWEGRLGSAWRGRIATTYRNSTRDTLQFGIQESEEIGVDGALNHPLGGVSLGLAARQGVSDFLPDPASGNPFLPGTDLVSESDAVSVGAHWKLWRALRLHVRGRMENRDFMTIGKENILSYHPQVEYAFNVWRVSLGLSHYERSNSTDFADDTWLVKITRRFF